jgi:predicted P-loop ATPase
MANNKQKEFEGLPEKKIEPDKEIKADSKNRLIQIINYLKNNYDIRFNVITTDTEYKKKNETEYHYLDDMNYIDLKVDVKLNNNFTISKENFEDALYSSHCSKRFDPFKDYLKRLPLWDGTDYIAEYFKQIQLDNETDRNYLLEGFKKWFVALVVSLVEDEIDMFYINQICLVFTGKQGRFKTTFFQRLLPKELQKYFYAGKFIIGLKDHEKYLATKIIINFDELAAFNKHDNESVKSLITQAQVETRLPYKAKDIRLKRRASFCGTINNPEFLRDDSGERRFFVMEISDIDLRTDLNVDNLYAQALALYKNQFQYWFNRDDIDVLEEFNAKFKLRSMEEELILQLYSVPTQTDRSLNQCLYLRATQIANDIAEKYTKINVNNTVIKNIGMALRKNKFKKHTVRLPGGGWDKLWCVVKNLDYSVVPVDDTDANSFDGG